MLCGRPGFRCCVDKRLTWIAVRPNVCSSLGFRLGCSSLINVILTLTERGCRGGKMYIVLQQMFTFVKANARLGLRFCECRAYILTLHDDMHLVAVHA